jgi:hypothetical protein
MKQNTILKRKEGQNRIDDVAFFSKCRNCFRARHTDLFHHPGDFVRIKTHFVIHQGQRRFLRFDIHMSVLGGSTRRLLLAVSLHSVFSSHVKCD